MTIKQASSADECAQFESAVRERRSQMPGQGAINLERYLEVAGRAERHMRELARRADGGDDQAAIEQVAVLDDQYTWLAESQMRDKQ